MDEGEHLVEGCAEVWERCEYCVNTAGRGAGRMYLLIQAHGRDK